MEKAGIFKKISILVLVLIVPGFLYYLLTAQGKNRYKPLSVFGPKLVASTTHKVKGKDVPDTVYHTIGDFKLTDQNGRQVSLKDFDKKIIVANFFYTSCPTVCKEMDTNVGDLVANYAKNKGIFFASISVDPGDNAAVLKKYADSFKPASANWLFLSGDTSAVYSLARNGFLVNAVQAGPADFIYSDKLILIDWEKRIRGYYAGASVDEVNRLNDEIKVLISEELRKHDTPLY